MGAFWNEFCVEFCKYIVLIGVAVAGAICGSKFRIHKDAKKSKEEK
jgi:hypothetical protein